MSNVYETDALVSQYCELHYGSEYFEIPLFPVSAVDKVIELTDGAARGSALDVGCAVGRSVFELAHDYEKVEGVDFSEAFIKTAEQMCFEGELRWDNVDEGELTIPAVARLEEIGLEDNRSKVSFAVEDACALSSNRTGYDLITAFNLLCRLPDPKPHASGP